MGAPSGMQFGRYEALFRVAKGGMAEVFAGRIRAEGGFERLVAIKRMLPHLADDERFVSMFLEEARLAAAVSSSHVVPTLDLGRDGDGSPYIVLQLVVGASLAQLMQRAAVERRHIPIPVALEILAQTAIGLHHAHEAHTSAGEPLELVHRDVSPQNVLVGASGAVLVSDFGIAKGSIARATRSEPGGVTGKLAYLSPEQARGEDVDRRTDVYSLAIVAWEVLAQRRLHTADRDEELLARMRRPPPARRLDEVRPGVPAGVADAIERALAPDPADRLPTAEALADAFRAGLRVADPEWGGPSALGRWLTEDPPAPMRELRRKIRASARAGEATEPLVETPEPSFSELEAMTAVDLGERAGNVHEVPTAALIEAVPTRGTPPRRFPWAAVLLGALVLTVITVVTTLALRGGDEPDPPPVVALPPAPPPEPAPPVEAPVEPAPVVASDPPVEVEPPPVEAAPEPAPTRRRARRRRSAAPAPSRRGGPLGMQAFDQSTGR